MTNKYLNQDWLIKNYQQYLMENYPMLESTVNEVKVDYADMGVDYTVHSFFNDLTSYTKDLIKEKKVDDVKQLMEIAEILLEYGERNDENLYNAVATCYIENLVNTASHSEEKVVTYDTFVPYLGPKAKEYCRYWDDFMGGPKTPGVYD